MGVINNIKYFFSKFEYLRVFFSPFKTPKLRFYMGKIAIGTPYFYPRRWVKSKTKPGNQTAVPKKIGFDFVRLGWKTKWEVTDYRFEWSPLISFVFFKWQMCVTIVVPHTDHYWESWLYYYKNTDKKKSRRERIKQMRKEAPEIWTTYDGGKEVSVNYHDKVLKRKYLKK